MKIESIIQRYLDHSTSEEENKILLQWLEEKEENRLVFKQMYDLWLHTNALLVSDAEMEEALNRLKEQVATQSVKPATSLRSLGYYLVRIAALFFLLFSAGYFGYRLNETTTPPTIVTMHKLLTGADGKGQYTLPDGSTVWLNANSCLEYPETFDGNKRLVKLDGEALFEVEKDEANPFVVEAKGMEIEVVGTLFLVQNYDYKAEAEAVLVNGSVHIQGDYLKEPCLLTPGQRLSYDKEKTVADIQTVNTFNYISWINSKLVFDNTPLADIIINLEKWYGVEIVAPPVFAANTRLSFTVRRESLEELLKYMTITAPIAYKWEGDQLRLFPQR